MRTKESQQAQAGGQAGHLLHRRVAVGLLFFTNGALFASIVPRYPAIKAGLSLSNAEFGFAVAAFPLGALGAGLAAGWLVRACRSSRVAVAGTILLGAGIFAIAASPTLPWLVAAFAVAGAVDAVVDVAQNAHGLRVQGLYGRSILNSFHAVWSAGAVSGGLLGGIAAGVGITLLLQVGAGWLVATVVVLAASRWLIPGPEPVSAAESKSADTRASASIRRRPFWLLLGLASIAACAALVEDSGATWSAVYLSETLGASASVAALGYVAMAATQFVGRVVGDRLVDSLGQRLVARAGGLLVFLGMGSALIFPTVPTTVLGYAAVGFGIATLIPAAMHAADRVPGVRAGTGLALVSWIMRVGFLLSPPLIGALADAITVRWALAVVPAVGLLVLLLANTLSARPVNTGTRQSD